MGDYEKGNWVVTSYLITYTGMDNFLFSCEWEALLTSTSLLGHFRSNE